MPSILASYSYRLHESSVRMREQTNGKPDGAVIDMVPVRTLPLPSLTKRHVTLLVSQENSSSHFSAYSLLLGL
jgi:hypothetical protein